MSGHDDATLTKVKEEMLPFLTLTTRPDLKSVSLTFFLGLTGTTEGVEFIKTNPKFLEAIVSLTSDGNQEIVKDAFKCLLNLAVDDELSWMLLNLDNYPQMCLELLRYVLDKDSQFADLVGGLLANVSRTQKCALRLVETINTQTEDVTVDKIVDVLCNLNYNKNATLDCLGFLFSNLTQISSFRGHLMDKNRCLMQRLVTFTDFSESHLRRGGVIGAIKNCCFETDYHDWLMGENVDILPRLLLPLAGPEEFDDDDMEKLPNDLQYLSPEKTREPDPGIRKLLVEAIMQLCSTKRWRLHIISKNAYVVLRELHKWETEPANHVTIQNLIDILIGDEPQEGMEELHNVVVPEHLQTEFDDSLQEQLKDASTILETNK